MQNEDLAKQGALFAQGQTYETVVSQIIDQLEQRLEDPVAGGAANVTIEQLETFTQVIASNVYDHNVKLLE